MSGASTAQLTGSMTDCEVLGWFDTAQKDLAQAATDEPNSDWHQACLAAVAVLSQEMDKRGFSNRNVH